MRTSWIKRWFARAALIVRSRWAIWVIGYDMYIMYDAWRKTARLHFPEGAIDLRTLGYSGDWDLSDHGSDFSVIRSILQMFRADTRS